MPGVSGVLTHTYTVRGRSRFPPLAHGDRQIHLRHLRLSGRRTLRQNLLARRRPHLQDDPQSLDQGHAAAGHSQFQRSAGELGLDRGDARRAGAELIWSGASVSPAWARGRAAPSRSRFRWASEYWITRLRGPPARGRSECRVRAAPAVSCARCTKKNAHEHTGSAEAIRHSLRDGFTAYFALSLVTGLFATIAGEVAFTDLTPASGRQDHTTSPSASSAARLAPPKRPPHPAPNVRDDGQRPSARGGTAQLIILILANREAKYFSRKGWTCCMSGTRLICPPGKNQT